MAILNKGGQLLANATQRTVVFETEQQRAEFLASLPSGVNIEESFDIYVKETATVYAAGEPFKMRATLPNGGNTGEGGDDNPPDIDGDVIGFEVWFSPTGSGDGFSAENPAPNTEFSTKLNDLAAQYDFGGLWVKVHLANGDYPNIHFSKQFYNCAGVKVVADGKAATITPESDEATVIADKGINLKLVNLTIQEKNSAVLAVSESHVLLDGVRIDGSETPVVVAGKNATVVADGCDATIVLNKVTSPEIENGAERRSFFLATNSGRIVLADGDSFPKNLSSSNFSAKEAMLLAEKHGVIDVSGCTSVYNDATETKPESPFDVIAKTFIQLMSGASLYISASFISEGAGKRGIVCDNQSYIVEVEE